MTFTVGACFAPHIADGGFQCDPSQPDPCPAGYSCRDFGGGSFLCTNRLAPLVEGDMAVASGGGGGGGGGGSAGGGGGGGGASNDMATPKSQDMAMLPPDMTPPPSNCTVSSLVINEVETQGTGGASDEYVEIFNPCGNTLTLSGKLIYRAASSTTDSTLATITSASIAGGGYYLIAGSGYVGTNADLTFSAGGLAAAGGGVQLRDSGGTAIDSVAWAVSSNGFAEGAVAPNPPSGQSISRHPNGTDTDKNNVDFVVTTPTPRAVNQ